MVAMVALVQARRASVEKSLDLALHVVGGHKQRIYVESRGLISLQSPHFLVLFPPRPSGPDSRYDCGEDRENRQGIHRQVPIFTAPEQKPSLARLNMFSLPSRSRRPCAWRHSQPSENAR